MRTIFQLSILMIICCITVQTAEAQYINKIDSLELSLNQNNSSQEKIELFIELSDEYKKKDAQKALEYAQRAYQLSLEDEKERALLKSLINLSQIYWSITDFKMAMQYAELAKEKAKELNFELELAQSLQMEGLIYIELSNYDKSSEVFFRSLTLFEQINNKIGISKSLSYIGSVYMHQNNYDKALEYYFKSLNIAKKINNLNGIARGLNNIAVVYEAMEDYSKAGNYFQDASEINKKLGNIGWQGINYMNLGTINLRLKKFSSSLDYFNKALTIFKDLQSIILQARCYANMANYYLELDENEQCIKYAQQALQIGQGNGLKQIVFDASGILQQIYLKAGDKERAYNFLVLQFQVKDSLVLMENKAELAKLELQYKFDKKEQAKQIEQQNKDLAILIVIISLLLALIVIILILARLKTKAKNALIVQQKLEHELESKNKEMTTNVMTLMKKNEILSAISQKLISIQNKAVKEETKEAISKISKEIQKITNEEILEEFELRFNQVHTDFYNQLLKKYPGLSPSEQRLCAFLRLNMTSKEIAELTGQQTSSLETARYRLRKKLGISNSQTNLVTFLSQL